jgi:excisionase family DNA binding protein
VDGWLTITEAASRLNTDPHTVHQLIDAGLLTGYRQDRVIRLDAEEVEAHRDGQGAGRPTGQAGWQAFFRVGAEPTTITAFVVSSNPGL